MLWVFWFLLRAIVCESWLAAPVIYEVYAGLFIPSYAQEVLDEMPESMMPLEFTQNKHDMKWTKRTCKSFLLGDR